MKIKSFKLFLEKNNYSNNTIVTYINILSLYKNDFKNIVKIKNKILNRYKNANTIHTHFNVICSYMKWASDKRIDILKQIKLPKIPVVYMNVFTKKYLLKKTKLKKGDSETCKYKKNLVKFLFETGIRANELFNIIEIKSKTLKILGKGNKVREIFHNYETTKSIKEFIYTTKTLRLWVKEILGEKFTPHSIRRSMATHLLLNGASPKMVMTQLGHEKVETTYRYLNLSLEDNWKIYNEYF
ncbi:integrase/recombinase XerD [Spiroplasma helicoides]|uniref:Integrase/recombinase XerD n=1 Tax=Spiroplasma helicoides TaxID=216938 RepID=A0A1B3SKC4_9MOLU|nr:site-specific integrase [Spiroplasma helicoides]AOG60384.1 integrase/recombinase XerD [Spiroplasma helicoides]